MTAIHIEASRSYDVEICRGILPRCGAAMNAVLPAPRTVCVVTDSTVEPLYGDVCRRSLTEAGYTVLTFVIPAGESSKCLAEYGRLLSFLADNHVTRRDCLAALGGGVVGDLTGFAAATYLRGVPFVQLPTTLLAMVDSSVGGKTAVDLPEGKNLAGAFYQPWLVLCDPDTLATLPPEIYAAGMAEVIKYGMFGSRALFDIVRNGMTRELEEDVIARCVAMKRDVVREDENDTGLRQILNYGHTIGHTAEAASGYTISHGFAVAMGMAAILKLADAPEEDRKALSDALKANGLPEKIPFPASQLLPYLSNDKKRAGGTLTLVMPDGIGRCFLAKVAVDMMPELLEKALED